MRLIVEVRLAETSLSHVYGGDGYSSGSLRSKFTAAWRNRWHDLSVWQKVGNPENIEGNNLIESVDTIVVNNANPSPIGANRENSLGQLLARWLHLALSYKSLRNLRRVKCERLPRRSGNVSVKAGEFQTIKIGSFIF